jgi:hypothetical protein
VIGDQGEIMTENLSRRGFVKCSLAACGTVTAGMSLEDKVLLAQENRSEDKAGQWIEHPQPRLPRGKIGHVEMTRLILGGNLIGGVAHARDLMYVSPLVRHDFTDEKILDTWQIAEAGGTDTMAAWPSSRMLGL